MKKLIFIFFIFSVITFAHKINIFTYKEGNKIFVEGYFQDGSPCKNSPVEVYNEKSEKILDGKTDEKGIFSFDIPDAEKIKIVLTADMGHKVETEMELKKKTEIKKEEKKVEKKEEKTEIQKGIDEEKIKEIVEESVEKAINPLIKEIEKEKQKIKLTDIIGGIGYIFGILGIYLYFRGRSSEWKK
ncbi:MAG TPA: hypothetical protein PKV21_00015 [bacterium]|nr:hypothetical protein [bacterium]HOM25879.1 hypothetical protein [bacterium]